jgi:acid phosphatase (class A)
MIEARRDFGYRSEIGHRKGNRLMTSMRLIALLLALGLGGAALAAPPAGYLPRGTLDVVAILPPPPVKGSYRYEADRRIFRETRRLEGSPRWQAATEDAETGVPAMLRAFSCSVGIPLTPENAPRTTALLARLYGDLNDAVTVPKNAFKRLRPFLIDKGRICASREELTKSWDYPSGHTVLGWSIALILAEAVPDRASEILARGRAYGESRVVCGAHNASAIEAGRTAGAALVATLHGSPAFRDDVAAARSELAALRATPGAPAPDAPVCTAQKALLGPTPY